MHQLFFFGDRENSLSKRNFDSYPELVCAVEEEEVDSNGMFCTDSYWPAEEDVKSCSGRRHRTVLVYNSIIFFSIYIEEYLLGLCDIFCGCCCCW